VDPKTSVCPRCNEQSNLDVPLIVVRYSNGQVRYRCPACGWKYLEPEGSCLPYASVRAVSYEFGGQEHAGLVEWSEAIERWRGEVE
jgi:transposase-like protein